MKTTRWVIVAVLLVASTANAFVIGGSNLGFSGYPDHSCDKPTPPHTPLYRDELSVTMYNTDVERYNRDLETYIDCIKTYLENARNDIQRIEEKYDETVRRAKEKY
ncbi:MAG: hypothetical protein FPO08_07395 [Geobacter sp.]|nr:MAG: hypothetical protein FPO08_07395 [Geobacter sp.]